MAKKKWKKQKRKNVRIIAVVLGGILIMMAFVLSLRSLSTPFFQINHKKLKQKAINSLLISLLLMRKNYKTVMESCLALF